MDPRNGWSRQPPEILRCSQDLDQRDWDEYAERLTFTNNTARDRIRGEIPCYMEVLVGMIEIQEGDDTVAKVNQCLREAIVDRSDRHNDLVRPHPVDAGSRTGLYSDRVCEEYAKKLVHLWHGPFRVAEKIGEYAANLDIVRAAYNIFPVGGSKSVRLVESDADRFDFDKALLPEDSWIQDRDPDEYEVDRISDMSTGKRTRYGRIYREFLVRWRGSEDPTWVGKQISTAAPYVMSFCEIASIVTDLA
ncbi:reverse transcriptase [Phytophthora megakarya]|uniref:Reverse transcriptase n=1 Tax=Phytophthora megakarya TaxID=4795 RepID=A0A225W9C5_9STRA|nr:reverse transcriptase [Phytophthora megakarya]